MRGIKSCFDNDPAAVAKFHTQTTTHLRRADQIDRQQFLGARRCSARPIPGTIIIQRMERNTARTRECLAAQTTLLKILHQAFGLRLAPRTSFNNRYRISHASTSSCIQICEKSGFARMDTVLQLFFDYRDPNIPDWEEAVLKFSDEIPKLAKGVTDILEVERKKNNDFREKFEAFAELCKQSINPNLTDEAIRKMLVQHLLTERIFRKVFNNQEFLSRNVIAEEIEKVIHSITAKHFSRDTFLQPLDRFYTAIEKAAEEQEEYTEKQHFLNAVYEKFFQSFDKDQADTHGIVYTPQPIVSFMVCSVEEVLKNEFGKSLSDEGVHILDPFTGTGNFITRIIQQIRTLRLKQKYATELHCNEVMLLPYYIASMNIEHAYMERTKEYATFEGICLVDTFDLAEPQNMQLEFMTEGNTERILKQKKAPIRVVIGNPPYNMGQVNENDQNKNRKYLHMDKRVHETYTVASTATLRNKLSDPYVKAFRLASDRIRTTGGIVAYVSNNSFIDQIAFDGMRKHLVQDFSKLYILDLGGNVRQNTKLSGTIHNVFGIQVGVAISILIKHIDDKANKSGEIFYARLPEDWRRGQRTAQLDQWVSIGGVKWKRLKPDARNTWLTAGQQADFYSILGMKNENAKLPDGLFNLTSLGASTNRDEWVYGFSRQAVKVNVETSLENLAIERARFSASKDKKKFKINADGQYLKWSDTLIRKLKSDQPIGHFHKNNMRVALYRPFCRTYLYFDPLLIDRPSQMRRIFPPAAPQENVVISCSGSSDGKDFFCLASDTIVDLHFTGDSTCFPFFTYDEAGNHREENITDWALCQYRAHYASKSLTKWDIFHSTYAVLHHPEYRARYAANLKRELPRIPFPSDIKAFAKAGKRLMELHISYENQIEYALEEIENPKSEWSLVVERMSLSKDKTELRYNEALTLRGIPPESFEYRLGNRSPLEWVIDQYRVSTDSRSGIVNDPNRSDDERYILRLIGKVITVSLETVKIVKSLPSLNFKN